MNSVTFAKDGDYVICYLNGKEMGRAKMASIGISEEEIEQMIEANPEEDATAHLDKIKLFDTIYNIYISSDSVDDTDATNKFVTSEEKSQITINMNDIASIRDGESINSFSQVEDALTGRLKRLIVQSLPTEDIDTNTIYMVLDPESVAPNNIYNEYMYISNAWELIGSTKASGPVYSAGTNVSIENNVISATDTTYTAGTGIDITDGVISATGGGGSVELYEHNIMINNVDAINGIYLRLCIMVYSNSNTPLTITDLLSMFSTYTGSANARQATGYYWKVQNASRIIFGVAVVSNELNYCYIDQRIDTISYASIGSGFTLSDTVTQLL